MYCKYCGEEIIEGKRYCIQCGKPAAVAAPEATIHAGCDICNGSSEVKVFEYYAYTLINLGETRDIISRTVTKSWSEKDFKPLSLKCCDECILKRIRKGPMEVPLDWQKLFLDEIGKAVSANGGTDWCSKEAYRLKQIKRRLDDLQKEGTPGAWTVEDSVRYYAIVEDRLDKCASFGAPAVGPIIELAGLPIDPSNTFKILFGASDALAKIGYPSVEPLIKALEDGNNQVRAVAARALGKIGDPRAVKPVEKALGDQDKEVRTQAKKALRKLQGK